VQVQFGWAGGSSLPLENKASMSIIPRVPSTVTNLTTIMVAEHIYRRAYSR